jgi:glycosyltransferase involved in cell wall biosynthesis
MNDSIFSIVSIITVVYNDVANIEKTILSVTNQTYPNIEYIVIDGGSTDGTLDIISKYRDSISYFNSEKDNGIYYAMNKGLSLAKGEWVYFLNCGDTFQNANILSGIDFSSLPKTTDVIHGNIVLEYKYGLIKNRLTSIVGKMPNVYHQATFVRTETQRKYPFDPLFKYCADFNSLYNIYKNGGVFEYKDIYIANYEMTGFSAGNLLSFYEEKSRIDRTYNKFTRFKFQIKHIFRKLSPAFYDFGYYLFLKIRSLIR